MTRGVSNGNGAGARAAGHHGRVGRRGEGGAVQVGRARSGAHATYIAFTMVCVPHFDRDCYARHTRAWHHRALDGARRNLALFGRMFAHRVGRLAYMLRF